MTKEDLLKAEAPFLVVKKGGTRTLTLIVEGFTANDPLGVGGGLFPDMPAVFFKGGGWLLVTDLIRNYDLVEGG